MAKYAQGSASILHSSEAKLGQPRRLRWLALALTLAAVGLAAWGDDDGDETGAATTSGADSDVSTDPGGGSEEILIKTQVEIGAAEELRGSNVSGGEVLDGPSIGDSPVCPGGTFRDAHSEDPDIGFVDRTFQCPDGRLRIGVPPQNTDHAPEAEWSMEGRQRYRCRRGPGGKRSVAGTRAVAGSWRDTGRAMSQENVELYKRGIDAFNRRDLDAFLALAHPGVVGVSRVLAIEGGAFQGHDGAREWWNNLLNVFPDFTIEVVSVCAVQQFTVAEVRNRAHGEGSAASLEELVWQVSEWRDGRVVRWQMYESEQDALEAAGLSE